MFSGFTAEQLAQFRLKYDLFLRLQCRRSDAFREFVVAPSHKTFTKWANEDYSLLPSFHCASGETKVVFWNDRCDVVIKIPFLFYEYEDGMRSWLDHCACEARNYELARREGLDGLFASCIKLMDFEFDDAVLPVYMMEYLECDEESINESCEIVFEQHYRDEVPMREDDDAGEYEDEMWDTYNDVDTKDIVEALLIESWGEDTYCKFSQFCQRNLINDIHQGNIGECPCGFKIVDYSGYGEICEAAQSPGWWKL